MAIKSRDVTRQEFIKILQQIGTNVEETEVELLRKPLRIPPPPGPSRRSKWFLSLPKEQQDLLRDVIREAIESTIFHLLAEFDGEGSVGKTTQQGSPEKYELNHVEGETRVHLVDEYAESLHDLYNGLTRGEDEVATNQPSAKPMSWSQPFPSDRKQGDSRFSSIAELDPAREPHPYLRQYKLEREERWHFNTIGPLQDLSVLLGYLLCLERRDEVIRITRAVHPLVPSEPWQSEIFQTEILSLGAYAAHLDHRRDEVADMLRNWNATHLGWRARTKTGQLAKSYAAMGTEKDIIVQGHVEWNGSPILCHAWIGLVTNLLILFYRLAGEDLLRNAKIT
jgi:hypothetical protein